MNIGADLIKGKKAQQLAEAADALNDATGELVEFLSLLEDAEREDREAARDDVAQAIETVLSEARVFGETAGKFEAEA